MVKTRIRKVDDRYYPEYRKGFFWRSMRVTSRWETWDGKRKDIMYSHCLDVAKNVIDTMLKAVEIESRKGQRIIEYPSYETITSLRKVPLKGVPTQVPKATAWMKPQEYTIKKEGKC